MVSLHNLTPLVKKRKRIGRGGSRGGTSTKGHKGQSARSGGKIRNGFEGGQMPLFRRLPKRGFINSPFAQETKIVNLEQLNAFEDGAIVDMQALLEKGIVKVKKGVVKGFLLKVLGNGALKKKLTITADAFSESAKKAIESLGGEARLTKEM
jgi:large subunit ribosomal protein L15